jgi:GDPmannose 4,6-dehydratase
MKQRVAFVTGANGQDGSYLCELLLSKNYRVIAMLRRHSVSENQDTRLAHLGPRVESVYGDLTAPTAIHEAMQRFQPDEVYNLAAQSQVRVSWDMPEFTANVNGLGVLRMLEAVRTAAPHARFYQASSSEVFGLGVDPDRSQRETTEMNPTSPYGCAKLFGLAITRHYRRAFGLFACNGILFNHESPRRGAAFVSQKVVKTAVAIKHGLETELLLGNMDSQRDWGHSADYTKAMWLILQQEKPDDFVIATGETRSVRDLCEYVFSRLGMDYRDYVKQDARYLRPEELPYLRGDSSKARAQLGWKPEYTFESMIDEMISHAERKVISGKYRIGC